GGTGGGWREVVEPLFASATDGSDSGGNGGGGGCVATVQERSKIAFKLPPRRSAAAPGDLSKPSPLAALNRKRRRGWSVSRRVSCFRESVPVARLHDGSDSSSRSTGGDSSSSSSISSSSSRAGGSPVGDTDRGRGLRIDTSGGEG
ncbi:unnamed protein product, partial [Ectocarpus fasciculatus]